MTPELTAFGWLLQHLPQIGLTAGLIVFIYALLKRWIVLGWVYDQERTAREKYEQLAWDGTRLAEDGADLADVAVRAAKRRRRQGDA